MNPTNRIAPNYDPPSLPFPQHMAYDDPGEPVFAPQPSAAVLVVGLALWAVAIAAVAGGLYWAPIYMTHQKESQNERI